MSTKRVLVVDDRPEIGEVVRRVAENLGYEIEVTQHANEFMHIYGIFDPNIIVLDIVMPEIDGIELVKWLNEQDCQAKVIVAAAYSPRYAEMATTLGASRGLEISFLKKPFRVAVLRDALT